MDAASLASIALPMDDAGSGLSFSADTTAAAVAKFKLDPQLNCTVTITATHSKEPFMSDACKNFGFSAPTPLSAFYEP